MRVEVEGRWWLSYWWSTNIGGCSDGGLVAADNNKQRGEGVAVAKEREGGERFV